jgi:hypothetical protein
MAKIDDARARWGQAEVHEGGGETPQDVDFSAWRSKALLGDQEHQTGIVARHFATFEMIARKNRAVIMVRKGKQQALRWIKLDYPAKPKEIKIKTSEATGIVTATPGQYDEVWSAGFFVLEVAPPPTEDPIKPDWNGRGSFRYPSRAGFGPGTNLPLGHQSRTELPKKPGETEMNWTPELRARRFVQILTPPVPYKRSLFEPGQVIDPETGLPVTSDYDLMGVFPLNSPGSKALRESKPGEPGGTNPYVQKITEELNIGFGGRPRIMHGPHDLRFDPVVENEHGCTVFTPEFAFFIPSSREVQAFYESIGRLNQLPELGTRGR